MSRKLEMLIQMLEDLVNDPTATDEERHIFNQLLNQATAAQREIDDILLDLKTLLYRNPSFPGDMVGWLDDDFDDDDADDDKPDDKTSDT